MRYITFSRGVPRQPTWERGCAHDLDLLLTFYCPSGCPETSLLVPIKKRGRMPGAMVILHLICMLSVTLSHFIYWNICLFLVKYICEI